MTEIVEKNKKGNVTMEVIKKLSPGAPGTKKLIRLFGDTLVCVRYRVNRQTNTRYTTVELIVEERNS